MQVMVRDNNIEAALRILKKKMQREGIFRQVKMNSFYSKPSEIRVRDLDEAIRRSRKLARKKAERDGLIPKRKPKILDKAKLNGPSFKPNPSVGALSR